MTSISIKFGWSNIFGRKSCIRWYIHSRLSCFSQLSKHVSWLLATGLMVSIMSLKMLREDRTLTLLPSGTEIIPICICMRIGMGSFSWGRNEIMTLISDGFWDWLKRPELSLKVSYFKMLSPTWLLMSLKLHRSLGLRWCSIPSIRGLINVSGFSLTTKPILTSSKMSSLGLSLSSETRMQRKEWT